MRGWTPPDGVKTFDVLERTSQNQNKTSATIEIERVAACSHTSDIHQTSDIRHPYRYHLRTSLEATVYGSIHHINERKDDDMARERSPRLQQVSPFGLSNLLRKEHRFVVPRRACYSDAQKDSQKHCSEEDNCGGSCGICPTTSHRKPSSLGLIGRAETRGRQVENG